MPTTPINPSPPQPTHRALGWAVSILVSLGLALVVAGMVATGLSLAGVAAETTFLYAYIPAFIVNLWLIRRYGG
ncbi:MAG: hypothetical protein HY975_03900 [Candidatus Kerfeldbacteria bacterium]|nr:hypothetical protein [Candidatus Kerfeldbacteria bacterium]